MENSQTKTESNNQKRELTEEEKDALYSILLTAAHGVEMGHIAIVISHLKQAVEILEDASL